MAAETRTKTELLLSHLKEIVKQHSVFDNDGRLIAVYTAGIDAKSGEPCLLTQYKYPGPNSTKIVNRVESSAEWNPDNQPGWEDVEPLPSPVT